MIKKRVLLTWLGRHDLDAEAKGGFGAIASILLNSDAPFDEVRILVSNWGGEAPRYQKWLESELSARRRPAEICFIEVSLTSPIDYPSIYATSRDQLEFLSADKALTTINLTSGTPAMIATWLLLGKGVYGTKLVQTSLQHGLVPVELPYDISLEYLQRQDGALGAMAAEQPDLAAHFEHIQSASSAMVDVVKLAKKLAPRNIPVIIQGESGTGKEVIAEAIHNASLRASKPFIAVNCGAIPESLIDSQLFGHRKGAFTGAIADRKGFFDEANEGTLFLDEVGELALDAQAKLLRALQQQEVTAVGASKSHKVNIRVIAATHRNLLEMVDLGQFREDLFYRLAVGIIQLPPLRERTADIPELVTELMSRLNEDASDQPGYKSKNISELAILFIKEQSWPGNIRELWNTLLRASIWSEDEQLEVSHLQQAMIKRSVKSERNPLKMDVSQGVDITELLEDTKRYYVEEALRLTAGQRGRAAALLGLNNHQTLGNWMKQLGINEA
ncbi:sigma-54 interaction domain-containing protein [Oceanisphaera sp. IT1-181]|uniref:sigma-54 interaction domain-containing protein n=1 Tax=Oceanisphaera sp. IT1-181 TaxID=3081199 RepID=UPI0029C9BC53|nr:sigma 54-interacting transcriptional regulator [Oceanisphaera sp. IT1-181]